MRRRYVRKHSLAALWSLRFGFFAFLLLIVSVLLHRVSFIPTRNFFAFLIIIAVIAFLSLLLGIKGLYDLWTFGHRGGLKSLKGLIYAFLSGGPLIIAFFFWLFAQPIYDVSTDTVSPPSYLINIRPKDALPIVADLSSQEVLQMNEWPQMLGRRFEGSPDIVLKSVLEVLEHKKWPVIAQSGHNANWQNNTTLRRNEMRRDDQFLKDEGFLNRTKSQSSKKIHLDDNFKIDENEMKDHLVVDNENINISTDLTHSMLDDVFLVQTQAKTFYLGFLSDIVIRLIDEGETTFVDMRATSQYLKRDFGNNARFTMAFMHELDTKMLLTPTSQEIE
ncbi:DUF1499 domain-containing protein [Bartonella tamiae]|uniref:DUF1499 domain-containing protein n=1 Tax=Bartonella tamiae Th239 TaxID=1094558 RepID=J1JZK0_9HYPH|nr:DUF1499 domain-containing protein [Bartonella tamiae]EJF90552.1 hypothetical protein ME5_00953 [Bartonella tamiae Th239]EJF94070.1 hypothetical protein MEG_00928 [Bartonella tamiae Th307]